MAVLVGLLAAAAGEAASVDPVPATLTAGAARVEIAVPPGTPLGGYGAFARRLLFPDVLGRHEHAFWFRPHQGRDAPVSARALVLGHGRTRIVWIAVDLVAVDRGLTAEVTKRLEPVFGTPATVIVSASHTHSGPGAFGDSEVMAFIALDRPDKAVRAAIVHALVAAARAADARRVPARLGVAARAGPAVTRGRLGLPVDSELIVLKFAGHDGRPIALVWNFAIHPTMLGPRNHALSDDVTGAASRALESTVGVPALFVNGAVGDVSPQRHGREATREVAATLAHAVQDVAARAVLQDGGAPAVATTRVDMGRAWLSVRNCLGRFVPGGLAMPLGSVFPRDAPLVGVTLGGVAWVTMPGELQSSLGVRIKDAARGRFRHAMIAGLSNDYLGYFVERAAFDRRTYVTCATLYGADAGERLTDAANTLLRGLGEGR